MLFPRVLLLSLRSEPSFYIVGFPQLFGASWLSIHICTRESLFVSHGTPHVFDWFFSALVPLSVQSLLLSISQEVLNMPGLLTPLSFAPFLPSFFFPFLLLLLFFLLSFFFLKMCNFSNHKRLWPEEMALPGSAWHLFWPGPFVSLSTILGMIHFPLFMDEETDGLKDCLAVIWWVGDSWKSGPLTPNSVFPTHPITLFWNPRDRLTCSHWSGSWFKLEVNGHLSIKGRQETASRESWPRKTAVHCGNRHG